MPELPEVQTVCSGLSPHMVNSQIVSVVQNRPDLRFPFSKDFKKILTGSTILGVSRRAKYILVTMDNGYVLVIHLGMSGRFSILSPENSSSPGKFEHSYDMSEKHDHVILSMSNGAEIRYNDARRFGYMLTVPENELLSHKLFKKLGVEPLSAEFSPDYLARKAFKRTNSIKAFLLDQATVAGLGNIYVCEALFRAKIAPQNPANILATKQGKANAFTKALVKSIKDVLKQAIQAGGSTLKDHRQTDGSLGYFQHSFKVYAREGAICSRRKCNGIIQRSVQNGRSTFYCDSCQL